MFKGMTLVPPGTHIGFMAPRRIFFAFSAFLVLASIALFVVKGLNYGIDFKGGIMMEVKTPKAAELAEMRSKLGALGLGDVELQEFGAPDDVLIRVPRQDGDEKAQQAAVDKVKSALGTGIEYRRTEVVGPKVSSELFTEGLLAVLAAIVAILAYVWFRFEWQFGVAAIAALTHDVATTIGMFSLLQLEFNLSTVAAALTIAGYSINDTVVVFDRVRENLRKYKTMPLLELFDQSINETLSRTILTSGTTLLALVILYFLGGPVIQDFSFAMIWGIGIGTYSSICVATPMLLYMNLPRRERKDKEAAAAEMP